MQPLVSVLMFPVSHTYRWHCSAPFIRDPLQIMFIITSRAELVKGLPQYVQWYSVSGTTLWAYEWASCKSIQWTDRIWLLTFWITKTTLTEWMSDNRYVGLSFWEWQSALLSKIIRTVRLSGILAQIGSMSWHWNSQLESSHNFIFYLALWIYSLLLLICVIVYRPLSHLSECDSSVSFFDWWISFYAVRTQRHHQRLSAQAVYGVTLVIASYNLGDPNTATVLVLCLFFFTLKSFMGP